jgi:hypothetical protein
MSLDDLSLPSASFSSEAGEVLTFFAYFFVSRQKSMWGMGQSPKSSFFVINSGRNNNLNLATLKSSDNVGRFSNGEISPITF